MGKQKGALKLKGTHGDFTFARTVDGFVWKEKTKMDKESFMTHPKLQKQRDNAAEFSACGKAVKFLRRIFSDQIFFAKDRRLTPRMQQLMMAITKADTTHERGQRVPSGGPLQKLEGFECNRLGALNTTLNQEITVLYNRVSGEVTLSVPAFLPKQALTRPQSATHYRIVLAAAEINFIDETFTADAMESDLLPIEAAMTAPLTIPAELTPGSSLPVFVLAGIRYSEVVNGYEYPDLAGGHNALSIVKVDII